MLRAKVSRGEVCDHVQTASVNEQTVVGFWEWR